MSKHVGLLVDLFNSCQLISVIQNTWNYLEKFCHYLPDDIGGMGIKKKVATSDICGRGI